MVAGFIGEGVGLEVICNISPPPPLPNQRWCGCCLTLPALLTFETDIPWHQTKTKKGSAAFPIHSQGLVALLSDACGLGPITVKTQN